MTFSVPWKWLVHSPSRLFCHNSLTNPIDWRGSFRDPQLVGHASDGPLSSFLASLVTGEECGAAPVGVAASRVLWPMCDRTLVEQKLPRAYVLTILGQGKRGS